MPVQKGKRRNRHRRRSLSSTGPGESAYLVEREPSSSGRKAEPARPRRRWELPLWGNALMGAVILIVALTLVIGRSSGGSQKYLFLVLYLVLAGFYLSKAARQYLARRQASGQ